MNQRNPFVSFYSKENFSVWTEIVSFSFFEVPKSRGHDYGFRLSNEVGREISSMQQRFHDQHRKQISEQGLGYRGWTLSILIPYLNFAERDFGFDSTSWESASMIFFVSILYRRCFSAWFLKFSFWILEKNSSFRRTIPWKCRLIIRSSSEWKLMQTIVPDGLSKLKRRKSNSIMKISQRRFLVNTWKLVRDRCKVRWVHRWQRFSELEMFSSPDATADSVDRNLLHFFKTKTNNFVFQVEKRLFFFTSNRDRAEWHRRAVSNR